MATSLAPGYEQRDQDHKCYNCGLHGHLFTACPEDTRSVPAGLEASRKRQNLGNDSAASRKRGKGPIVTHYPPPAPPGIGSHNIYQPGIYDPHRGRNMSFQHQPPLPPPPASHYERPAMEAYSHQPPPPGSSLQGPPQSLHYDSPRDFYANSYQNSSRGHAAQDVPYVNGYYGRPRSDPPPAPLPPRHYSTYSEGYERHPANSPHDSPSIAPYQPPPPYYEQYPPAPGIINYPPGLPQPYPSAAPPYSYPGSSSHSDNGPLPPHAYPSSHGSPPVAQYPYPPPPPPPLPQYSHQDKYSQAYPYPSREDRRYDYDRHSSQGFRRRGDRGRQRSRRHSPPGRYRGEQRYDDRQFQRPDTVQSASRKEQPELVPALTPTTSIDVPPANEISVKRTIEDDFDADFEWNMKTIFQEPEIKITKDLIREPLPLEWTEDPMMPPKYGAETVTSKFVTAANVDEFALSVRETKAWKTLQYHPAFLPPEKLRLEALFEYDSAITNAGLGLPSQVWNKKPLETNGAPRGNTSRPNISVPNGHHNTHQAKANDLHNNRFVHKKRSWDEHDHSEVISQGKKTSSAYKRSKVSSPEPGEVTATDERGLERFTTARVFQGWKENDRIENNASGFNSTTRHDTPRSKSASSSSSSATSPPYIPPSPQPLNQLLPDNISRPSTRSSSRNEISRQSRSSEPGSPLTPNERALLGLLGGDSDTERDSPEPEPEPLPKIQAPTPKPRRSKVVAAAYQRRW
ncbi:hypothetical protein F5Y18DRAFT_435504 [Xylariaceae sp. FL1019]|nr:hypothetical protein F5Y18DRAFT_435504 [Xylariaceae sp. FL1019]